MNQLALHAWVHGLGYHPTRDAECACGIEVHGHVFAALPPCTRADDERSR